MKNVFLAFLFLLSIFYDSHSQEEKRMPNGSIPLLKHFESTDYHGGIQNWSMDQNSLGILYVANNNGLLEFDGNQWILYDVPLCTKLRAVKVDQQNKVFVGGQGQIGYFDMAESGLTFTSLLDLLPPNYQAISEVWKIIEHDDKIFFNTESQIFVYDYSKIKVLQIPGYPRLAFDVENRLLVQFYNIGLFEYINEGFVSILGTSNMPEIISIVPKKGGHYYFCKTGEVFTHEDQGKLTEIQYPIAFGSINDAVKLSSGDLSIATQNNGLFILHPDLSIKQHLTKNKGLTDRTLRAVYEDDFKNLWVALNNGIDYLKLSLPFTLINEEVGLKGTGYAAINFKNQFYLGTSNGVFVRKPQSADIMDPSYHLLPGSQGQIYHFSKIKNELMINHHRGAFQLRDGLVDQFHDIGSWKFLPTNSSEIIIGGDYQGISFFSKQDNKWSKIRAVPGFYESSRVLEFENDSTLWMTHGSKGAYRLLFDNKSNTVNEIEYYGDKSGFPSKIMISVYALNNQLVFTAEKGIYSFDREKNSFLLNPFFDKWLGEEHVGAMVSGPNNSIYYIQNLELGLLSEASFGEFRKETSLFKHVNKYINDDLQNISILDDHNILIGAKEGFIHYDPKKTFSVNKNFTVLLRSVEVKTSVDSSARYYPKLIANKEIEKNQSIIFKYSAPYYDGFEDLKYSYRLLPLEKSWSKWSLIGEKEYPYLPSGSYTFEVKAHNIYGQESSSSTFQFKVLKPWYVSNWALLIYSFIALVIMSFIPIIQGRKHRTEKTLINKDKDLAIHSKNEEINQISQESKKEIDRLYNEKLRTEIDLKNDQLTTITMHLMKNNEFIQEIKDKIATNIDKGGSQRELQRIINTIDKNLEDDDSWDQFAYHFDQVHGGYLKKLSENNISLSPREIKLASFLRMNMSSKEISKLLNITTRSVELARYRLRKKLKLDRDQNLVEYLIELDTN